MRRWWLRYLRSYRISEPSSIGDFRRRERAGTVPIEERASLSNLLASQASEGAKL